jgi:leucyl-tRNA synthetase
MGPLEQSKPWETRAVVGSLRFLQRLWRNVVDEVDRWLRVVDVAETDLDPATDVAAPTIAGVREDYEGLRFNTAIAKLIELNNAVTKLDAPPRSVMEPLVLMVAPVAPHIAEELWARLGHEGRALGGRSRWPTRRWSSRTPSPASSRSRARSAIGSRCRPTSPRMTCASWYWPARRSLAATADGIRTVIVRARRRF